MGSDSSVNPAAAAQPFGQVKGSPDNAALNHASSTENFISWCKE